MNEMEQLQKELAQLVNKYGLDAHFGVSDRIIAQYLIHTLDTTYELTRVAVNQARIDVLTGLQSDAINQSVNGDRLKFDSSYRPGQSSKLGSSK